MPTGYRPVDFLLGCWSDGWQKVRMDVATSVNTSTRLKREAEKVEVDYLVLLLPIPVLAINDA